MTIPKTDKLYLDDSYLTTFRATVVSATKVSDSEFDVVLDASAFYPESGGQQTDRGTLGDCDVADVRESDEDVVVHRVRATSAPKGEVECTIDWELRRDHMQQHTGQHVLSRAFIETGGLHTVSFHMGDDTCTIDLEGEYGESAATEAERLANRIVQEDRPIVVSTVPLEELDTLELRRKVPDGITEARLVRVADFDTIPCCGTHVRRTGELGLIKVLKHERVKKTTRVYFKVGKRALEDYDAKHRVVQEVAGRFTTSAELVVDAVDQAIGEAQAAKKRAQRIAARLASMEASRLRADAPHSKGVALVVHREPEADVGYVRLLSNALKDSAGTISILAAPDGTIVCSASGDVEIDLPAAVMGIVTAAGGNGGGKGGFAQFKLPEGADVGALLEEVERNVTKHL